MKIIHHQNYILPLTFFPLELSAKADITLPNEVNDKLIAAPSLSLSPVAPVASALSLPAKSTRFINEDFAISFPASFLYF